MFKCNLCSGEYFDKSEFISHLQTHVNRNNQRINEQDSTKENDDSERNDCVKSVSVSLMKRNKHEPEKDSQNEIVSLEKVKCDADNEFKPENNLSENEIANNFKCDICLKIFSANHRLIRHGAVHENQKSFRCEICFAEFKMITQKQTHIKMVHEKKMSQICELCKKSFTNLGDLNFVYMKIVVISHVTNVISHSTPKRLYYIIIGESMKVTLVTNAAIVKKSFHQSLYSIIMKRIFMVKRKHTNANFVMKTLNPVVQGQHMSIKSILKQ